MNSHKRKADDESVGVEKKAKIKRFSDGECIYFQKEDKSSRVYLIVGPPVNGGYSTIPIIRDSTKFNRYMVTDNPLHRIIPDSAERIRNFTLCPETADKIHLERRWYDSSVKEEGDKSIFDFIFVNGEKKSKPQPTPILSRSESSASQPEKEKPVEPDKPEKEKPVEPHKPDPIPISTTQPKRSFNFTRRPGPLSSTKSLSLSTAYQKSDKSPKSKSKDDKPMTEEKKKSKESIFFEEKNLWFDKNHNTKTNAIVISWEW